MLSTWAGLPDCSPSENFGFQLVILYARSKHSQYWLGDGVLLWKSGLSSSGRVEKGYEVDRTTCAERLEDAEDWDDVFWWP